MFGSMHLNLVISCYRNGWLEQSRNERGGFLALTLVPSVVGGGWRHAWWRCLRLCFFVFVFFTVVFPFVAFFVFVFFASRIFICCIFCICIFGTHEPCPAVCMPLSLCTFFFLGGGWSGLIWKGGSCCQDPQSTHYFFLKSDWCPGWVTSAKREWGCGRLWLLESPM